MTDHVTDAECELIIKTIGALAVVYPHMTPLKILDIVCCLIAERDATIKPIDPAIVDAAKSWEELECHCTGHRKQRQPIINLIAAAEAQQKVGAT